MPDTAAASPTFAQSRSLVLTELERVLQHTPEEAVQQAGAAILAAKRIFVAGAGRSGLALRMVAMRLMHLGLQAFVAGDSTTPAIAAGDLLIVASASGTTSSVVHAAEVAKRAGAAVLLVTTAPASPLAQLATAVVTLPAAAKSDTGERLSEQYAGSLFEQAVLLLFDSLFHTLWQRGGQSAATLLARHANLE